MCHSHACMSVAVEAGMDEPMPGCRVWRLEALGRRWVQVPGCLRVWAHGSGSRWRTNRRLLAAVGHHDPTYTMGQTASPDIDRLRTELGRCWAADWRPAHPPAQATVGVNGQSASLAR